MYFSIIQPKKIYLNYALDSTNPSLFMIINVMLIKKECIQNYAFTTLLGGQVYQFLLILVRSFEYKIRPLIQ